MVRYVRALCSLASSCLRRRPLSAPSCRLSSQFTVNSQGWETDTFFFIFVSCLRALKTQHRPIQSQEYCTTKELLTVGLVKMKLIDLIRGFSSGSDHGAHTGNKLQAASANGLCQQPDTQCNRTTKSSYWYLCLFLC